MGMKPRKKPPQLQTTGSSSGGIYIHTAPNAHPTVVLRAGDHEVTLTFMFQSCIEHGLLPSADIMVGYAVRRAEDVELHVLSPDETS